MKKLNVLLLTIPSLYFAQIASPLGQIQTTTNPETKYIGIGTTTPESRLDIRADESIPIIRGNGGYIPTGLRFIDDSYTQPGQVKEWSIWKGNTWAKGLGFYRYDVDACMSGICALSLFLHDNGNVGIGTTIPAAKFHITGGHRDTSLLLSSTGNGSNQPAYLNLWASEPDLTYHGVGIGNNVRLWNPQTNQQGVTRFVENLGGSYMRLLDNSINFNTINQYGEITTALNIGAGGNVSISNKLEAKEIKVTNSPTADFVFENTYQLPKLENVEKHIKEKKHLPEIASAAQMRKEGVNIGEFQIKLLQKIEELTLYSIEQNKLIKEQQKRIKKLEDAYSAVSTQLTLIKK